MLVLIFRSCSIAGSATLTMLMSTEAMKTARPAAITSHHWFFCWPSRGGAVPPRGAGLSWRSVSSAMAVISFVSIGPQGGFLGNPPGDGRGRGVHAAEYI